MRIIYFLLLLCPLWFACDNKTQVYEDEIPTDLQEQNEWSNAEAGPSESIKSGIIHMNSSKPIHGSDIERIIYFDDYGAKRRVETTTLIEAAGQRITTTQITIDIEGFSYSFNPEKKTGYKTAINKNLNPTQLDFSKIDANTMQQFGIEKKGTEIIAGKVCTIYTINYDAMNFSGQYSVWNTITLREITRTADFGYEYVASKVEENVPIKPTYFEVPNEIDFQESSGVEIP
ncbi:MAG: hypothetical protein ACK5DY_00950 [Bacteroidota bacterium]|jgi:hypothetical protein